jgi:hypothetical protein
MDFVADVDAGFIEGGINHVVLCTDGDFNIGVSTIDALVELIEQKRKTGITLTALGYGNDNLNDAMMEKVSNAGNGIYSLITSEPQANDYVENRLLSTLEHVAKDVKIQLELNPRHVVAYRLLGYENRAIADEAFRDDIVDAIHRVNSEADVVWVDGHSDYGHAFEVFWDRYGQDVGSKTTVIVLGDARNNYHSSQSWVIKEIRKKARHVYWLNPEPKAYWDTGDSIVGEYATHCDGVFECRNLRQLERFIDHLA